MSAWSKRSVWLVLIYSASAVPVLLWAAGSLPPTDLANAAGFLSACLILVKRRVKLENGVYLPASTPINTAAMLILQPPTAVIVESVLGLILSIRNRRPPRLVVFNIANFAFPTLLGSLTFRTLVPGPLSEASLLLLVIGAFLGMVVRFVMNLSAIQLLRTLEGEANFWDGLWRFMIMERGAWFAFRALSLLIVLAYPSGGVWTPAIAAVLLLVVDDAAQLYITREALFRSARTDGLTQVLNRTAWEETAGGFQAHPAASHVLFVVDVNGLKDFNDCGGHAEGDRAIRAVASALAGAAGEERVYRYGGDEFVVWLENTPRSAAVVRWVQQTAESLSEGFHSACYPLSASVGVAYAPADGTTLTELFAVADRRMYEAKRKGKGAAALQAIKGQ